MYRISLKLVWIFLLLAGLSRAQSYNALIYEGNRSFGKKNFDGADAQYLKAVKKTPEDFKGPYNLGNSLYRQGKYNDAVQVYGQAANLARNKTDKAAALYNQGNALMKQGKAGDALEPYKEALKLTPNDADLQKNYRIAKQQVEKQKQQQKNQQNQKNQQPQNQNNPNKQNQKQDSGKSDQSEQDRKNQEENREQGGGKEREQPQQKSGDEQENKPQPGQRLSKEREEEILDAINTRERSASERILNRKARRFPQSREKDW